MEFNVNLGSLFSALDDAEEGLRMQIRPAAQAMAQVFYDEIRANLVNRQHTGNLYHSIYQFYEADASDETHANYRTTWRTAENGLPRAPHGHLVEFGFIQRYARYKNSNGDWVTDKSRPLKEPRYVAPMPFARPALNKEAKAQEVGEAVLLERFDDD